MIIDQFLSQTSENPIWQAKKGHGSFLTFDMGNKSIFKKPNGKEYAKGDIHLWIYQCEWVIWQKEKDLCHSESSNEEIDSVMKLFVGGVLRNISIVSPSYLDLHFSNDLLINLNNKSGFYADDDDFFTLSSKTLGYYLYYNQKEGFKVETANK